MCAKGICPQALAKPEPISLNIIEWLRNPSIGDAAITANDSLALGAVVRSHGKGRQGAVLIFQNVANELSSIRGINRNCWQIRIGRTAGILTHLYPSDICLFTVSL